MDSDSSLTFSEIHKLLEALAKHSINKVVQKILQEAFSNNLVQERYCCSCGSSHTAFTRQNWAKWYRKEGTTDLFRCHSCYNAEYYRNNKNRSCWSSKPATAVEAVSRSLALESPSERLWNQ